jgi:hypothetical protein
MNKANEREMYSAPRGDRKKCLYEYCLLNKNGAGNKNNDARIIHIPIISNGTLRISSFPVVAKSMKPHPNKGKPILSSKCF